MNKRIKKKLTKNKVIFNLKNLIATENPWDGCESHTGDLYKNDEYVTSFYEDPIEGGYYPNGEDFSNKEYNDFIIAIKQYCVNDNLDELTLFDKGISKLMNKTNILI